ncbi:MAG: GDP-L-fucose synthase [Patescibacteria group bacterium]
MEKQAKIYIAGHEGMLGAAIKKILEKGDYSNILVKNSGELDLLDSETVANFFKSEKPDYVFIAASKSGSIQANIKYPAEFIYENLVIQNNIIHNAYLSGVKKLLFFGASCVYPKEIPQPIKEEYFLTGELEPTSRPYAVAKIAGIEMCRAYNKQYGAKFISVVSATPYGPNDHFDLEKSHVLSALIRKFHEAKMNGDKEITLWGSGLPAREFIYIDDLAEACIFIMNTAYDRDLINIGVGADIAIKELAEKIKAITGFQGEIKWDVSKPDGAMKKLLDTNRSRSLGWSHKIDLDEGIKKTYQWFVGNFNRL